jgi:hypothetical protein
MIFTEGKQYRERPFDNEAEIETVVFSNSEHMFGPEIIFLGKRLIRCHGGDGTVPDGIVIDISSRSWYIVEAELASHSVWNHIAPQVSKQIAACIQKETHRQLVDECFRLARERPAIKELLETLDEDPMQIGFRLLEIFDKKPVIAIPIDRATKDLEDWAKTLLYVVRIWPIRKLVNANNADDVMYELPDQEGYVIDRDSGERVQSYNVAMSDLVTARLLNNGDTLTMSYGPRGTTPRQFTAILDGQGNFQIDEQTFSSPSEAALYCIQAAGSPRGTVNGWTSWKKGDRTLAELRRTLAAPSSAELDSTE